jgi:hypothetical protein
MFGTRRATEPSPDSRLKTRVARTFATHAAMASFRSRPGLPANARCAAREAPGSAVAACERVKVNSSGLRPSFLGSLAPSRQHRAADGGWPTARMLPENHRPSPNATKPAGSRRQPLDPSSGVHYKHLLIGPPPGERFVEELQSGGCWTSSSVNARMVGPPNEPSAG